MKVVCYAQREKMKSQRVMDAFCCGCTGRMAWTDGPLLDGDAAFYGVRPAWQHLYEQAKREGRRVYYLDNSFTDTGREKLFRIGVNAPQSWSPHKSDGSRLAKLGIRVKPWRTDGRHVLLTPQTDEFMSTLHQFAGWTGEVSESIKRRTQREIVVRRKGASYPLHRDLKDAWILVAHSSAAAIEALIAGIPVIVTDEKCAAFDFSSIFEDIERPMMCDGRLEWLGRLADSQFDINELRDGIAWKAINSWEIQ